MKFPSLALLFLLGLTSCSLLTARGRRERAYNKYIHHSQVVRDRHRPKKPKFRMTEMPFRKIPKTAPSDNAEGPQSVTGSAPESAPAQPTPEPN